MSAGLISIVVLNFNGGSLTRMAVQSALDQQGVEVEVVVVDNGSTDGSMEDVEAATAGDPRVRTVRLGRNTGFAVGMNEGIARTRGELVVPLNCDAVLHPGFAAAAVIAMADQSVGTVGALVVRTDSSEPAWDAHQAVLDGGPLEISKGMRVVQMLDVGTVRDVGKSNGACPVLRRSALDQVVHKFGVGPFDPWFVTYGEDVDLALKLSRLGWRTRYTPDARAAHVRSFGSSASILDKRGVLRTLLLRSRWINVVRHGRGPWGLFRGAIEIFVGDIALGLLGLVRGDVAAAVDVGRAWRDVAGELPNAVRFRRRHHGLPPPVLSGTVGGARRREQVIDAPPCASGPSGQSVA